MKFTVGSETDTALCIALKHEFLRCEDAFKEFEKFATAMIMTAQNRENMNIPPDHDLNRRIAFKMYDGYTRFVHHLYEFLLGAEMRERFDTAQVRAEEADRWIQANAQRVLTGRRNAILNGTAPSWENHISTFPEKVPPEFAREFRAVRNKAQAHVTHERASKNLTDFYNKYHKFLYMCYWNCLEFWGAHRNNVFPDLQEITDFSVLITKSAVPRSKEEIDDRNKGIMDDIWKLI